MAGWGHMKVENGFDMSGNPVIICIHPSGNCIVRMKSAFERSGPDEVDYFSAPNASSAFHDPLLTELADKLNKVLHETNAKRADRHSKLGILTTPQGFVPIWKYEDLDTAPEIDETSLNPLTDDTVAGVLWPE